jgi:hypothetical protein
MKGILSPKEVKLIRNINHTDKTSFTRGHDIFSAEEDE